MQKKSAQFTNSFLRYSRFYIPISEKAAPIFDHSLPVIIMVTFSNF